MPCIFPWSEELESSKPIHSPSTQGPESPDMNHLNNCKFSGQREPQTTDPTTLPDSEYSAEKNTDVPQQTSGTPTKLTFEMLHESVICLPPKWKKSLFTVNNKNLINFSTTRCGEVENRLKSFIFKEVIITEEMRLEINVVGCPLNFGTLKIDKNDIFYAEKLEALLRHVDGLSVCSGISSQNALHRHSSDITRCDNRNSFRHGFCPLLVAGGAPTCLLCKRMNNAISTRYRRQKLNRSNQRIRINVSPKTKAKLRTRYQSAVQGQRRALRKIEILKAKMEQVQEKAASYSEKTLHDNLENAKIHENQRKALNEILAAAKRKGPKGRRYSEEWILLCLLLHMRSPSGYRFLWKHNLLPLPTSTTIRRYYNNLY